MREKQFERVLRLVRRTGDKAVVVDRESDELFVIMDLDNYEGLLDVLDVPPIPVSPHTEPKAVFSQTEPEIEPIIEREPEPEPEHKNVAEPAPAAKVEIEKEAEPDVEDDFEPIDEPLPEPEIETPVPSIEPRAVDQEIAAVSEETTENLSDVADDGEEEKFYLEPLE